MSSARSAELGNASCGPIDVGDSTTKRRKRGGAAEARTGVTTGFAGHNSYLTEINPEIFLQTEPGATLPQMTKICPKIRLKLAQNLPDSQCF